MLLDWTNAQSRSELVNGVFSGDGLGVLRFDLNACPFGAGDPLPQAQVKLIGGTFNSRDFTLSTPFDSPACAYTHYDVPLGGAGWTYTDVSGSRPAIALDFAQIFSEFLIERNFFIDGNSVALDNVSLELGAD
jgi:hypothetical protein